MEVQRGLLLSHLNVEKMFVVDRFLPPSPPPPFSRGFIAAKMICKKNILSDSCESSKTNWKGIWAIAEYTRVYLPQDRTGQDRTGSWQLSQFLRCFLLKRAYPTCERQNYSGCFFFAIPLTSPPSFSLSLGSDRCPNRLLGKPDRRPQSQRQQKSLPLFHHYPASTTIGFNHLLFSGQKCKLEPPSRSIGWEP